ncbi:MAG: fibronectin type III domain-containing protein, partial [Lentisphaerales bacterium]|nr:fibronectin type III domain-containing protein [Lentisphaerales bacterium]
MIRKITIFLLLWVTLFCSAYSQNFKTFKFNGVDQYIRIPGSETLNFADEDFTYSTWLNVASETNIILFKKNKYSPNTNGFHIEYSGYSDQLRFSFYKTTGRDSNFNMDCSLAFNQWHHLTLTNENGTLVLYLNGVDTGQRSYFDPAIVKEMTPDDVTIGAEYKYNTTDLKGTPFDGNMSQILIFNRALSADEIGAIYNDGSPHLYAGLSNSIKDSCIIALEMSENDQTLTNLVGQELGAVAEAGLQADGEELIFDNSSMIEENYINVFKSSKHTPQETEIALEWQSEEQHDVTGYRIYLDGALQESIPADAPKEFTFTDLNPYTTYLLKVEAFNESDTYNKTLNIETKTFPTQGSTQNITINQSTIIGEDDFAYDCADLIITAGAELTVNGRHHFNSVTVEGNSTVTHSAATQNNQYKIDWFVRGQVKIEAGSKINVNHKGLFGKYHWTENGVERVVGGIPGSYGGYSTRSSSTQEYKELYGDYKNPNHQGSGGDNYYGDDEGGGLVRIVADSMILDGTISANGNYYRASGGGIFIDVKNLSHEVSSGSVTANGGGSQDYSFAGGGGRIAIYYASGNFDFVDVHARGGDGRYSYDGANGTVYIAQDSKKPILRAENSGRELYPDTPKTPVWFGLRGTFEDDADEAGNLHIQLGAGGVLEFESNSIFKFEDLILQSSSSHLKLPALETSGNLSIDGKDVTLEVDSVDVRGKLELLNGAKLTSYATTEEKIHSLTVNASEIEVDWQSSIDVTGKGCPPFYQWSEGGPVSTPTTQDRSAGSYGGYGAVNTKHPGEVYGSFLNPSEVGSGGSSPAGGLVRLTAVKLILDGSIRADGFDYNSYYGASGGGIYIDVDELTYKNEIFRGSISANGSGLTNNYYSGGGGRIAIYYGQNSNFDFTDVKANGGHTNGEHFGGNGTVFLQEDNQTAKLIFDNAGNISQKQTPLWFGMREDFSDDPTQFPYELEIVNAGSLKLEGELPIVVEDFNLGGHLTADTLTVTNSYSVVDTSSSLNVKNLSLPGDINLTGAGSFISSDNLNFSGELTISGAGAYLETQNHGSVGNVTVSGEGAYLAVESANFTGNLSVAGVGTYVSIPEIDLPGSLTVSGEGAYLEVDTLSVGGDIELLNYAVLKSFPSTTTQYHSLTINANNITVDKDSSIDVSGKGLPDGYLWNPDGPPIYYGDYFDDELDLHLVGAASYGGYGAYKGSRYSHYEYDERPYPVYGDFQNPNEVGSSSGSSSQGGGLVRLTAETLLLDGSILATGTGTNSTGSSGGGIYIDVDKLSYTSKSGSITANG